MSLQPVVSLVLIVRGKGIGLERTLKSIALQSLQDFELLVIDDASGADAEAALASLNRSRVRLHRSQRPKGLTAALVMAHEWASGEFIAYHDAGDVSAVERLERQVDLLRRRDELGAVSCGVEWVDSQNRVCHTQVCPPQHHMILNQMSAGNCFVPGSVMARRQAVEAAVGIRAGYDFAADYDLWLRMADQAKLGALQTVLYRAVIYPRRPAFREQAFTSIYEAVAASDRDNTDAIAAARERSVRANRFRRLALQAAGLLDWHDRLHAWEQPALARQVWLQALLAWPFSRRLWQAVFSRTSQE